MFAKSPFTNIILKKREILQRFIHRSLIIQLRHAFFEDIDTSGGLTGDFIYLLYYLLI